MQGKAVDNIIVVSHPYPACDAKDRDESKLSKNQMKSKTSTWAYRIITLFAGAGILFGLIYCTGFRRFWNIVLDVSGYWIAVSVG